MQIFFLSLDPQQAAQQLCDKHCVKMPLETMQIISTIWSVYSPAKYKEYHLKGYLIGTWQPKHPSIKWAGLSIANYWWTVELLIHLCAEYTFRYNKHHKYEAMLEKLVELGAPDIPTQAFIPMSKEYQAITNVELKDDDPVISYRCYYVAEKVTFAKWDKGRAAPQWWHEFFDNN